MSETQSGSELVSKLYVALVVFAVICTVSYWILSTPKQLQANALVKAITAGEYASTKALLDKGANPNSPDGSGTTPLIAAFDTKTPNLPIAELLINKGAKVNQVSGSGDDKSTPLMLAAENSGTAGNAAGVNFLLEHGANIETQDDIEENALSRAIEAGQVAGVRALLETGAEVNDYSSIPGSPLTRAARLGNIDIMELLLAKGASVNGRGSMGDTALTEAATFGRKDAVLFLLKHGANVNEPGEDNKTAIREAVEKGNTGMVALLKQEGARE